MITKFFNGPTNFLSHSCSSAVGTWRAFPATKALATEAAVSSADMMARVGVSVSMQFKRRDRYGCAGIGSGQCSGSGSQQAEQRDGFGRFCNDEDGRRTDQSDREVNAQ